MDYSMYSMRFSLLGLRRLFVLGRCYGCGDAGLIGIGGGVEFLRVSCHYPLRSEFVASNIRYPVKMASSLNCYRKCMTKLRRKLGDPEGEMAASPFVFAARCRPWDREGWPTAG